VEWGPLDNQYHYLKVMNLNARAPMTRPLELEPGSNQDVEVLRLEVEELKREEDRIRFLRQEKEDRLRALIFRIEMAE